MNPSGAVVWFKRDLRISDHRPLHEASQSGRALGLIIIEPQWLESPEYDPRHGAFLLACIDSLDRDLTRLGLPLLVGLGEAVAVLEAVRTRTGFARLLSHEETGPGWSYTRDRAVAGWARSTGVDWQEWPQTGVVRRLRSRSGWAAQWARRMNAPQVAVPGRMPGWAGLHLEEGRWDMRIAPVAASMGAVANAAPLPRSAGDPAHVLVVPARAARTLLREHGVEGSSVGQPLAGERAAQDVLASFIAGRGRDYRRALSSPLTAEEGCSRLSAHLAFGTVSMRRVHQATEAAIRGTDDRQLAYGLRGFASRLRWHCHFMQKLESQVDIEWRNIARSVDGLRAGDGVCEEPIDSVRLQAWQAGCTGYPMVDACMRQLCATGWLNFRMRAMLVSFAAYHLWLHWRAPGLFLARQFLDFEPGIHWSQMQMQSGTTGINTLRIYSPAKQARDQDPTGAYLRRWIPEWGTAAYPSPIVEERAAIAHARQQLYGVRRSGEARAEAAAIQDRLGSRKSGLPQTTRRSRRRNTAPEGQGTLF